MLNIDLGILKIYNASAGSGKTFFIIKNCLLILLSSDNPKEFKKFLILTFTRKSSNDIKNHILECLKDFSNNRIRSKYNFFFNYIINCSSLTKKELCIRSKKILYEIYCDFKFFTECISTIDKFTYRIIRSFYSDFSLEMDTDKFLKKVTDNLIKKLKYSDNSYKNLIQFSIKKIKEGKSWDISKEIYRMAFILINENHFFHIKKIKKNAMKYFIKLKYSLEKRVNKFEKTCINQGIKFIQIINKENTNKNINLDIINLFKKFIEKDIFINPFKKKIDKNIDNNIVFNKQLINNELKKQIINLYKETKLLYNKNISQYILDKVFLNEINLLPIIYEIENEFSLIKKEKKILLNEELNQILYEKINYSLPIIYEKIGNQYKYYFIDEFQDISFMQWKNIEFLIENSLSENGIAIIVGDPKQSIYRWRGGDSKQFLNLIYDYNPVYKKQLYILNTNFRSCKEIVIFNNLFYSFISNIFYNSIYRDIYKNSNQKISTNNEYSGYVELNFINSDIKKQKYYKECICNYLINTIKKCLEQKYFLSDIVILVRTNKEGYYISENLIKKGINVNTSVSMLIKDYIEIKIIINFLYILTYTDSYEKRITLISLLLNNKNIKINDVHYFISKTIFLPLNLFIKKISSKENLFLLNNLYNKSIYYIIKHIIDYFNLLNKNNQAYIYSFLDFVYRSTNKIGNSIIDFLYFWEKNSDEENIIVDNNIKKSVYIMTIHKSKGLQFPVVILPFVDWNIYSSNEKIKWINVDPNLYQGLNNIFLTIKSSYKNINNNKLCSIYKEILSNAMFDNINLLYVATTRSIQQLILFSKINKKKSYISYYIKDFLCNKNIWNYNNFDKHITYSFGKRKL
ncbi:UvrD-helicase domain-containing protein [Blattabacterium cuenoti]|uniref:UvrD-helicase domain-containing protein n=1 Tax=Blattabacterium cuenoti TaxID=1653831 RepID=UPI00163C8EBD|nr:UvrD-helicase domain-containing protein [Blattabacterium cuenoti]